jgi:ankyrin repeat protein
MDGRALLLVSLTATVAWSGPKVDFRGEIQPLLRESCLGCHGPTQQLGRFRFDKRSSVRKVPGRLQPGSSATSRVYLRVAGSDFGPRMPPTGALRDDQVALIRDWIDQGAEWPDELAGDDPAPPPPDPVVAQMVEALRRGDPLSFRSTLDAHPQAVNRRGIAGSPPLLFAALYGDAEAVALLLERGADPNLANDSGATALMWAVGDLRIARRLLDHGADVNATSEQGHTPLSIAAGRHGSGRLVELLLERGAQPRAGGRPAAALIQAASAGNDTVFRKLIEHGADPKAAGAAGLMLAARADCGPCIDVLIAAASQADLSHALVALSPFGDTPLLGRLIDRGADVNARISAARRDMKGRTPLMLAASSDLLPLDTVRLLVARGADVNATGPEGETALDLARRNGETSVVELLVRAGAKAGRGFPTSAVTPKPAASARAALQRIIPLLQRADVTFVQKTGCVSCHHDTFTAMTIATARARRVPLDEAIAGAQLQAVASVVAGRRDAALLGSEIQNTASSILVGLAAQNYPADVTTDALAHFLKGRQDADGRWRSFFVDHRPPIQSSDIEVTATSIRALRVYAPKPRRSEYEQAVERGLAWLMAAEPRTNDERALQLLGLAWAGLAPKHGRVRTAARALLAEQRGDGGWAQLPTLGTDAYATGQALVALHEAGALQANDAAYRRGVRYLLDTQLEDGSWYVKTRALPFQPYFESGFPHGPDQWISIAASNWAAMALALAAPARASLREQRRPVDHERERLRVPIVLPRDGQDPLAVR